MSTTSGAVAPRPTRTRYLIMVMLFVTVVINYLDRSNLSVASTGIAKDPHLTTFQQGLMLSAFGWTYAAAQIPGGWLVDRVPPRVLYPAALVLWSLATCLMGVVGSFVGLFVLRLAVGAFEAPAYPINNKVVTAWFPERERAGAIGFYTSGQFVGLALLTPSCSGCRSPTGGTRSSSSPAWSAWCGQWCGSPSTGVRATSGARTTPSWSTSRSEAVSWTSTAGSTPRSPSGGETLPSC